jgi:hypothetical protein
MNRRELMLVLSVTMSLGLNKETLPGYRPFCRTPETGLSLSAASCGEGLYSLNCAARHLTAAGTPSVATISRNFCPNSVLVA